MLELLMDPPFWFWISIAAFILLVEINLGTFDLLWPAAGAALTGLVSALPFLPSGAWEWVLFIVITLVLTVLARTMGLHRKLQPTDKRPLNNADTRIGQPALALSAFEAGRGRVRLGDTDWTARAEVEVSEGQNLVVTGVDGTELIVQPQD